MIRTVISSGSHIYAAGGSSLPYISPNPNNPIQGMLRVNGSDMEVFDGNSWMKLYLSDANIGLNNSANEAIDWAIKRMEQEKEWEELAATNHAVKIALDNLNKAREQLDITAKLAREYEQSTS